MSSVRKVEVVPYDDKWPMLFQEEADKLRGVFGSLIHGIHHIGSTSVPGLSAKPVIDILVEVENIDAVDRFNDDMRELGYEPRGEYGIAGRRYFQKGGNNRTHHVHMYQTGHSDIDRHLIFRDFMRANPDKAREYGQLKESLAQKYHESIEDYINGKDAFVKEMERQAQAWHKQK